MRTTLTLDKDVAQRAKALVAKEGKPFKQVVNEALRLGLDRMQSPPRPRRYRYKPHDMGVPRVNLDNIQEVLARFEGDEAR